MFSLKTKDVPPKRAFLIVLIPVVGSILAISTYSLMASSGNTSLVKEDAVIAQVISEEENSTIEENLVPEDDKPVITTYTVVSGDTLSGIADKFSISTNTLLWANDLTKKSTIKVGQKLTILPVSGIVHSVKKGDTLGAIALKYDASTEEIIAFNDLEDSKIKVGMKLIIPDGELPEEKPAQTSKPVSQPKPVAKQVVSTQSENKVSEPEVEEKEVEQKSEDNSEGYFTHPIPGSILTQGKHGFNSVDFGAPVGTSVYAAASGKVIIAKPSGYNGGYGKNIVIEHDNGTQTLYAHLSFVSVSVGDEVKKGEKIALSGNTGRSTGPHLHFEVRGGTNPWTAYKKLTQF
ncbi:M23 family metallopeptidase [Candidatus Nomurabacteria bacterium]|nr:M23 family metallopeptidase [Candidatus Nomurabacteria bacterium]